jgi:hypothetical protein
MRTARSRVNSAGNSLGSEYSNNMKYDLIKEIGLKSMDLSGLVRTCSPMQTSLALVGLVRLWVDLSGNSRNLFAVKK